MWRLIDQGADKNGYQEADVKEDLSDAVGRGHAYLTDFVTTRCLGKPLPDVETYGNPIGMRS